MVTTEVKQTDYRERKDKGESIFNHYSIENEADFLRKIGHLPLEEREFYIRENMLCFLGEYVGQVPYKKIAYFLKNGRPFFAGFPVLETYKKTALMAGTGSREWFEYLGFDQAMQSLQEADINSATIISPSKIADYGFVFHFVKDSNSDLVEEYILRFPEKIGELGKSRRIAEKLSFENTNETYQKLEDFLANPLLSFSNHKRGDLDRLLGITGISKDEIVFSDSFEQAVINDDRISSWLKTYFQKISSFAEAFSDNFEVQVKDLQFILAAIYNRAKDIKRDLSGDRKGIATDELRMLMHLPDGISHWRTILPKEVYDIHFYALKEKPAISAGGGNCPTVKNNSSPDFISVADIFEELSTGKTIEQIISKEGRKDSSTEKKIKCPECGWEPTEDQLKAMKEERDDAPKFCPNCGWDPCTKSSHLMV